MPGQGTMDSVLDATTTSFESSKGDHPLQSLCTNSQAKEACRKLKTKKVQLSQPPNTVVYTVKPDDKLTSIAACYDTTPSVLKKVNRLTMDFLYPDQILYVPANTGPHSGRSSDTFLSSGSSFEDEKTTSSSSHMLSSHGTALRYPGFAHRLQDSDISSMSQSYYRQQTSSSADEGCSESKAAENLEQYLVQMFVKIRSHYIASEQDGVKGTLLVTPNAVMFDPNVSDPLVLEKGVEEYGMIAKLDTVISAAIYRDSNAIHNLRLQKEDPTVCKPEVYHMEGCQLAHNILNGDETDCSNGVNIQAGPLSCSCGADGDTPVISPHTAGAVLSPNSNKHAVDWEDNCWNKPNTSESTSTGTNIHETKNCAPSKVPLNIERDTNSLPIDCARVVGLETLDQTETLDESGFDYNLDDGPISQSIEKHNNSFPKKFGHRRTASAESSLYSVGMASNTEIYVDYSCGMFTSHGSCSSNETDLLRKAMLSHYNKTANKPVETPVTNQADDEGCKPLTLHLEAGVSKEERPSLFQPISDLVADASKVHEIDCQPFYLCLQVGQPIKSQCGTDTCPIEAYRKQKKPEYWFIIPGDKVDALYKFFIQWRPELYGEEITDDSILNSRGFIAIPPNGLKADDLPDLAGSPLVRQVTQVQVYKDWEILSIDEIVRRQCLLDVDKYVPFPDLRGESTLMSEEDIKQLAACLPARVEGHRWRLAYSSEEHGFSLNTLYRNMCEFESATIVVVLDDNDGMFGAFSSSPLNLSEHFYGTGECFLFTFVGGFKSYNWSSKNMFCVRGAQHGLTFGTGSATCGLWLDADIYHGRTQHCDTYENEPLTGGDEDFIVKGIEVWSLNDEEYD